MNACSKSDVRRCRPLLGTFVEITASGLGETQLGRAVGLAFNGIENIQRLLSAHDPASELSLLNRQAATRPVTVSRETYAVLGHAEQLAAESGGAFDHTVAAILARWGLLPNNLTRKKAGNWQDVVLLGGGNVRFRKPLALDLGGIAKGFAVDQAVEILHRHGVPSGVVNAGGDLRVFGAQASIIHLRHPGRPQAFARSIDLVESALATSSPYFTERLWRGQRVSHLVNPARGRAITGGVSVTVRARECWLADALTKVVLNAPRLAERLLKKYEAEAFVLSA